MVEPISDADLRVIEAECGMLPIDLAVAPLRNRDLRAFIARLRHAEAAIAASPLYKETK